MGWAVERLSLCGSVAWWVWAGLRGFGVLCVAAVCTVGRVSCGLRGGGGQSVVVELVVGGLGCCIKSARSADFFFILGLCTTSQCHFLLVFIF